jgi:hypothetical protein
MISPLSRPSRWLASLAVLGALACSAEGPIGLRPAEALRSGGDSDPVFLETAAGAPSLASTTVSFWAVKGKDREAFIYYNAEPGEADSTKLVRFRVGKRSLCKRPDGSNIANGDSLLITMTVVDPERQQVKFEPAGLQFCSGRPAKLNMWYEQADHDFDDDGDIDAADATWESFLSIWKQETPTSPWEKVTTVLQSDDDEAEASITGFTSYLVAY